MIMIQVHNCSASFLTFDLLVWWAWSSNDSIHSLVCKDFNSSISTSSRPSESQYRSTEMNNRTMQGNKIYTEAQVSIVSICIYLLWVFPNFAINRFKCVDKTPIMPIVASHFRAICFAVMLHDNSSPSDIPTSHLSLGRVEWIPS